MTGAAARARMTMLTTIYRNTQTEKDPYGHRKAPKVDDDGTSSACYAWNEEKSKTDVAGSLDGNAGRVGFLERLVVMFPKAASITANDRLGDITDRQAAVLFAGPWIVDGVRRRATHFEASARKFGTQP